MKSTEFSELKQSVKSFTPTQKKQLEEMLSKPEGVSLVAKLLDAKLSKCPHCGVDDLYKWEPVATGNDTAVNHARKHLTGLRVLNSTECTIRTNGTRT